MTGIESVKWGTKLTPHTFLVT